MKRISRTLLPLFAAVAIGGFQQPAAGQAEETLVVVELFTSQGCNSCPPADALIGELAGREDVLAMSMHVDYWDYLGWKDTLAIPATTKRQYSYRDAWGSRYVYTPQMVVGGHVEVRGARAGELDRAIERARASAYPVDVSLSAGNGAVTVTIEGAPGSAEIWVARYAPKKTIDIARGENAGKKITYHNVVSSLEPVGTAGGLAGAELTLDIPDAGEGLAVWVQEAGGGRILGAKRLAAGS